MPSRSARRHRAEDQETGKSKNHLYVRHELTPSHVKLCSFHPSRKTSRSLAFRERFRNCELGSVGIWEFAKQCAVQRRWDFSGCNSRPGTGSLHPVAIEAAAEATKSSELSMERVAMATPRA